MPPHPGRDQAWLISRVHLAWAARYIYHGFWTPLQHNDLPTCPKRLCAEPELFAKAEAAWAKELAGSRKGGPNVIRSVWWQVAKAEIIEGSIYSAVSGLANTVGRPLFLRWTLLAMDPTNGYSLGAGLGYAGGLIAMMWLEGFTKAQAIQIVGADAPTLAASATMHLLGKKAVSISTGAGKAGAETALVGNDLIRSTQLLVFAGMLVIAVFALVGGFIFLLVDVGAVALSGILVFVLQLFITGSAATASKKYAKAMLTAADTTTAAIREMVDGAKVVKLQCWEQSYKSLIQKRREAELIQLRRLRLIKVAILGLGRCAPILANCVTFCVYWLTSGQLTAATIFPAMQVFQSMRVPFIIIPVAIPTLMQIGVSGKRLSAHLALPDQPAVNPIGGEDAANAAEKGGSDDGDVKLVVDDASLGWPKAVADEKEAAAAKTTAAAAAASKSTSTKSETYSNGTADTAEPPPPPTPAYTIPLNGTSLTVRGSELVAITGPVGCGKSTLLAACWGEAAILSGRLEVRSTADIGVIFQRPFVIGGTVLENILMGRPFDEERMAQTLRECALEEDMKQLPDAEKTHVGERGVTLSGGQQQRIAVARALYSRPQLLLADDPLSAVDARTQAVLLSTFTAFARGSGRAIMCSLNQPHHLNAFDRVVKIADGVATAGKAPTTTIAAPSDDTVDALPEAAPPPASAPAPAPEAAKASAPPAAKEAAAPSKAGAAEAKKSGGFDGKLISRYLSAMGPHVVTLYYLVLACSYSMYVIGDLHLTFWVGESRTPRLLNGTLATEADEQDNSLRYLAVYVSCSIGHVCFLVLSSTIWAYGGVRASRSLHSGTINRLAFAPLWWYDDTPSGRILSRYTSDIGIVDMQLSEEGDNFGQISMMCASLTGVMLVSSPVVAPVICVALVGFCIATVAVDRSNREVRRLSNNSVSPIISAMHEMRNGGPLIRAMGLQSFFRKRLAGYADEWSNFNYLFKAIQGFGFHVTNYLVVMIGAAMALYLVLTREERDPSLSALTLTYSLLLPYFATTVVHHFTMLRTAMASLERLLEYLHLPQERPRSLSADPEPSVWPKEGRITFCELSIRYRPELPPAVDGLSAVIEGGQKAGVVGRTGAGKSSLVLALFRLVEASGGKIEIDGVDVSQLGLGRMRNAVTIIPQDPTLHKGSVAHNLDPFGGHSEAEMLQVLQRTQLPESMLYTEVEKAGSNLSSGERQLLCFARALLQRRPILVLDEATSNLDADSDARIQALLRSEFDRRRS